LSFRLFTIPLSLQSKPSLFAGQLSMSPRFINSLCTHHQFIKITPENPVLWTGMKGVSAKGRKKRPDAETSSA
jgi:hypothetical protein